MELSKVIVAFVLSLGRKTINYSSISGHNETFRCKGDKIVRSVVSINNNVKARRFSWSFSFEQEEEVPSLYIYIHN